MLVKKAVLQKRLQKKLDALEAEKASYDAQWPVFQKALAEYHAKVAAAIAAAPSFTNRGDLDAAYEAVGTRPTAPDLDYYWTRKVKAIRRNMDILDALDGDSIEVGHLKTGRNFSLESLFGDDSDTF